MIIKIVLYFLFASSITCIKISSINNSYEKGVAAYSEERWSECIAQLEETLHLFKLYKSVVVNCRSGCSSQKYSTVVKEQFDDLLMYENIFRNRNCLHECFDKEFMNVHLNSHIDEFILNKLRLMKPYEYIHICYFQMNALPKAANAVYTFLTENPDNEQMKMNLKYYLQQPEVDKNELVDLEGEDFRILHKLGLKSYDQHNWGETVAAMEEVLTDYMAWENVCRMECERLPEQQWSPEFVVTISNNIASLLQCRQQCQDEVKSLNYESGKHFLADVLNYLQISYYKLDRLDDAVKALTSYLLILPSDPSMLKNKVIYQKLIGNEFFKARHDIQYYVHRDENEKKLLNIFYEGNDAYNTNTI